jgi:hypothetical protein
MYNSAGFAIGCLIGLILVLRLSPDGLMGYILAFGVVIGVFGFIDHGRYMRKLRKQDMAKPNVPNLRDRVRKIFPNIPLDELTDDDLLSIRREIEMASMAASFGDPRGYADLEQDIRIMIAEKKR